MRNHFTLSHYALILIMFFFLSCEKEGSNETTNIQEIAPLETEGLQPQFTV